MDRPRVVGVLDGDTIEVLVALEAEARAARRGIWSLPESERVPRWEWRRERRR